MRLLKIIIPLAVLGFMCQVAPAQQVPMYSQYIMNGFLINPSLAGRDGYTTATLTTRNQWVGLANSPATYAASFQTRILKRSYISKSTSVRKNPVSPTKGGNVGFGGYIFTDNNGIMRRTGFQAIYAYHIQMGITDGLPNDLAFGLGLSAYNLSIDFKGLNYDQSDPLILNYDRSVFITDFKFVAYYTTSRYYAGFAMTNILRGSLLFANNDTTNAIRRELGNYYLTGGYKFTLSNLWSIEPTAFIKSSDMLFRSIQLDLTARVIFKEDYWAGLSLRTNDAVILFAGLKYDKFIFGYSFDFTLTDIRRQSFGSHEITFAVRFGESARRYRWINSF